MPPRSDGVTHLQFVWFYVPPAGWMGAAAQHQVRPEILRGEAEIIVIGANPGPWFTDTLIEVPASGMNGARACSLTSTPEQMGHRLRASGDLPGVCLMMDDQFFVNPVTKERLEEPKADPFYKEPKTQYAHHMRLWMRLVIKPFQWCQKFGPLSVCHPPPAITSSRRTCGGH